jgi:hypothetical protein
MITQCGGDDNDDDDLGISTELCVCYSVPNTRVCLKVSGLSL